MPDRTKYHGREQTFVKHFFLENYLERVAFVTLAKPRGWSDFAYLDGFAGPWMSQDGGFSDTSVKIALTKLMQVKHGLERIGRNTRIRAIFVEQRVEAYRRLCEIIGEFPGIEAVALSGSFYDLAPECANRIGNAFSLSFIDPTSFEVNLEALQPILSLRGEVIINLIYSFLTRNLDLPQSQDSLGKTFADTNWRTRVAEAESRIGVREEAVLSEFGSSIKRIGGHRFVTSTRVKSPLANKTHFHLVYATNHWRGLEEFRRVESQMIEEQEAVRSNAKASVIQAKTRQAEMFPDAVGGAELAELRIRQRWTREMAELTLMDMLRSSGRLIGREVFEALLQIPLISRSVINDIIRDSRSRGVVDVRLPPGQRVIKADTVLVAASGSMSVR